MLLLTRTISIRIKISPTTNPAYKAVVDGVVELEPLLCLHATQVVRAIGRGFRVRDMPVTHGDLVFRVLNGVTVDETR